MLPLSLSHLLLSLSRNRGSLEQKKQLNLPKASSHLPHPPKAATHAATSSTFFFAPRATFTSTAIFCPPNLRDLLISQKITRSHGGRIHNLHLITQISRNPGREIVLPQAASDHTITPTIFDRQDRQKWPHFWRTSHFNFSRGTFFFRAIFGGLGGLRLSYFLPIFSYSLILCFFYSQ